MFGFQEGGPVTPTPQSDTASQAPAAPAVTPPPPTIAKPTPRPPPTIAKPGQDVLPENVYKSDVIPDEHTVNPDDLVNDALNTYKTPAGLTKAYGSGQITFDTAQAAKDHLQNQYDNADSETQAAMRKAEDDALAEDQKKKQDLQDVHKAGDVLPADRVKLPTGVTPQNQAEWEALAEAGQYTGGNIPWTAETAKELPPGTVPGGLLQDLETAQAQARAEQEKAQAAEMLRPPETPGQQQLQAMAYAGGLQKTPILDAMGWLDRQHQSGAMSDDAYNTARSQLVHAQELATKGANLPLAPAFAGQPEEETQAGVQKQILDIMNKAVPVYMQKRAAQAQIEVGAGAENLWNWLVSKVPVVAAALKGMPQAEDVATGAGQNSYLITRAQQDARLNQARTNYNQQVDKYTVNIPEAQRKELTAAGMMPKPGAMVGTGEVFKTLGDAIVMAGGLDAPGALLADRLLLPIISRTGGVLWRLGDVTDDVGSAILSKTFPTLKKRVLSGFGGAGVGTGLAFALDPRVDKSKLTNPATARDAWLALAEDAGATSALGVLGGAGLKGIGKTFKLWGNVSRAANPSAFIPLLEGRAIATGVGTEARTIPGTEIRWPWLDQVLGPKPLQAPVIPFRAAVGGNPFNQLAVQVGGRSLESYVRGMSAGIPYAAITSKDANDFLDTVNKTGLANATIHALPNIWNGLRGTAFDFTWVGKGENPDKPPPWQLKTYGDQFDNPMVTAFNGLNPSHQNAWRWWQGFAEPYSQSYLLPRATVQDIARSLGHEVSPAGFVSEWDPTIGKFRTYVSAEDFDKAAAHELTGHIPYRVLHPNDQARLNYLVMHTRAGELDNFVDSYAHQADNTLGKMGFGDLPTTAEITPGNPQFNQGKADLYKRSGLTKELAQEEFAADTLGQLFKGQDAHKWTQDPSLLRQFQLYLGKSLEGLGLPTTTGDVNGPITVPKHMLFGYVGDPYLRRWARGEFAATKMAPEGAIQLPPEMEKGFQEQRLREAATRNRPGGVSDEDIRARAYENYQRRQTTGEPGDELTDWLKAETDLKGAPIWEPPKPTPAPVPSGKQRVVPGAGVITGKVVPSGGGAPPAPEMKHAPDSPEAHAAQEQLKGQGYSPGAAQSISEGEPPKPGPKAALMPGGETGSTVKTQPSVPVVHPARDQRQQQTQVQSQPQEHQSPQTGHKLVGVVGSEYGEIDNPERGGYSEPGWNRGAWDDDISGENNPGAALPPSVLRHVGYHGQKDYGKFFNSNYIIRIHNPGTGASAEAPLKDLGPGRSTGALIDMQWKTRQDLGFAPNFKGAVNFEIVDKKTGQVVYAPTGHEIEEGGGGPLARRREGAPSGAPGAPGGLGPGAEYGGPGAPQYEAQEEPQAAPGGGVSEEELQRFEAEAQQRAPAAPGPAPTSPGVVETGFSPFMMPSPQTAMQMGYFQGPPEAPGPAFMPAGRGRGPKRIGGVPTETEEEEQPTTINNPGAANARVAPHLAKGTVAGLDQAMKEHAASLSPDDARVHKGADGLFKGEYFQPGDALHEHVLGNMSPKQQQMLRAGEQAIANRQPMHITYASAPREGEQPPTTKTRQIEYEASSPEARMLGKTTAQLAGHTFIPTAVGAKLASKQGEQHQGYIQGVSMNAAANNHYLINRELAAMGKATPYPTINTKFRNDLEGYVDNLNHGYKGTGDAIQASTKEYPVQVDPNHVAYRLKRHEADFLNAVINNTAARAKKGQALRELAREGGTLLTPEGETNPIRRAIDERHREGLKGKLWSNEILEPTIRSFRAGLIHELHPSPEHMPEGIRPGEEFKGLAEVMERTSPHGRPDVPMSVSFMPGGRPQFKSVSPEEFITQRNKSKRPQYLSELNPEDIRHHQLYTNQEGTTGVAIDPHGDIQNVFNNGGPQGAGAHAVTHAIANGGRTLDAYDHFLPAYYRQFGFNETGRMKFNRAYAKSTWDFEKDDEPDVVFMGWNGYPEGGREGAIARATRQAPELPNERASNYYQDSDWDRAKEESRAYAQRAGTYRVGGARAEEEAQRQRGPSGLGAGEAPGRTLEAPAFMPMAGKKAKGFQQAQEEGRTFESPQGGRRFEISDQDMKFKPAPEGSLHPNLLEHRHFESWGEPMKLSEAITHPELFKNYPQLRKTKIRLNPDIRADGFYLHPYTDEEGKERGDTITLKNAQDRDTLAHEIQHAAQYIEGHPSGTSTAATYQDLKGNPAVQDELRKIAAERYPNDTREEFDYKAKLAAGKPVPAKELNQQYIDHLDTQALSRRDWIDKRLKAMAMALYQRSPGELEARVAGQRATEEARWQTEPRNALEREMQGTEKYFPVPEEAERAGAVPEWAKWKAPPEKELPEWAKPGWESVGPAFMPGAAKLKGIRKLDRALSPEVEARLGPRPDDPKQERLYQRVGERLDTQIPEAIPLEPAYDDKGKFRKDEKGGPLYKKVNYDIANAPLLQQQGKALGYAMNTRTGLMTSMAKAPKETVDDLESLDPEKRLIPYLTPTDRLRVSHLNDISAVNTYADELVKYYKSIEHLPEVMAGKEWYDEAKGLLENQFGAHSNLLANLLAATSAGNKVKINYNMAINAYHQYMLGNYDRAIDLYRQAYDIKQSGKGNLIKHIMDNKIHEALKEEAPDTDEKAMEQYIAHHGITPKNAEGKLFGHNSIAVLKVLAHTWEEEAGGPKTPNFAGNLNGRSLQATIDMWAARTMRRLGYEGRTGGQPWLIQPSAEPGVNNVDFGLSQLAFRKAAEQIGIKPSSLQAILWFAEQKHWQGRNWERAQDAEDRDYRPMLKAYKRPENVPAPSAKRHPSEPMMAPAAPG
jgi:hypothetical protein